MFTTTAANIAAQKQAGLFEDDAEPFELTAPGAAAKHLQHCREADELANHKSRAAWLGQPAPCWADGAPVAPSDQYMLLEQSLAAIRGSK